MRIALVLALIAVLCWSTVATAFKIALESLSPIQLLLNSSLVATVTLLLISLGPKRLEWVKHPWTIKRFFLLLIAAGLNPCIYYFCLFEAYDRLMAQQALALNYTWPFALVLLHGVIRLSFPKPLSLLYLLIGFTGILVSSGAYSFSLNSIDYIGVLFALSSAVVWALYWLIQKIVTGDELINLTVSFSFASLILVIFIPFTDQMTMKDLVSSCYVGVMEMAIPFYLWSMAVRRVDKPERIVTLMYLSPVLSVIWISLVLGEALYYNTIIGLILILISSVLCVRQQAQESSE